MIGGLLHLAVHHLIVTGIVVAVALLAWGWIRPAGGPPTSGLADLAVWLVILIVMAILFGLGPGKSKTVKAAPPPAPVVEHVTRVIHAGGLSGTDITIMVVFGLAVVCGVGIVANMRH